MLFYNACRYLVHKIREPVFCLSRNGFYVDGVHGVCDLDEINIVCVRSRRDLRGTLVKVSHLVEIRQQLVAECLP
jgi:hypothetical protein